MRPWRHAGLLNTKISCLPEESQTLINYLSKVPNEPLSKKGDCVRLGGDVVLDTVGAAEVGMPLHGCERAVGPGLVTKAGGDAAQ